MAQVRKRRKQSAAAQQVASYTIKQQASFQAELDVVCEVRDFPVHAEASSSAGELTRQLRKQSAVVTLLAVG